MTIKIVALTVTTIAENQKGALYGRDDEGAVMDKIGPDVVLKDQPASNRVVHWLSDFLVSGSLYTTEKLLRLPKAIVYVGYSYQYLID